MRIFYPILSLPDAGFSTEVQEKLLPLDKIAPSYYGFSDLGKTLGCNKTSAVSEIVDAVQWTTERHGALELSSVQLSSTLRHALRRAFTDQSEINVQKIINGMIPLLKRQELATSVYDDVVFSRTPSENVFFSSNGTVLVRRFFRTLYNVYMTDRHNPGGRFEISNNIDVFYHYLTHIIRSWVVLRFLWEGFLPESETRPLSRFPTAMISEYISKSETKGRDLDKFINRYVSILLSSSKPIDFSVNKDNFSILSSVDYIEHMSAVVLPIWKFSTKNVTLGIPPRNGEAKPDPWGVAYWLVPDFLHLDLVILKVVNILLQNSSQEKIIKNGI